MSVIISQKLHTHNPGDEVGKSYIWPKSYWKTVNKGDYFIYYHPVEPQDKKSYYFGYGIVGDAIPGASSPDGHPILSLEDYVSFPSKVPIVDDNGDYLEGKNPPWQRSIRSIRDELFIDILHKAGIETTSLNVKPESTSPLTIQSKNSNTPGASIMTSNPVMKILYGPPGTGKTYQAAREAVRIIDGIRFNTDTEVISRYRDLVAMSRIFMVTFHPSYSYEDFVEGFRPQVNQAGNLTYSPVDGPFKIACNACRENNPLSLLRVGQKIGDSNRYEVVEIQKEGVAFSSLPNRKNQVTAKIYHYAPIWMIDWLKSNGISSNQLAVTGLQNNLRKQLSQQGQIASTVLTNAGAIKALWEFIDSNSVASPQPVVLIIDEINRADLSRVFGELMTLLEKDKRRGATEERAVILPYSKSLFSVPANLSVIGTMNTADRSLAVMDVALRRRFEFIEIAPDPALCPQDYGQAKLQELLGNWNNRITALRSRDFRLGHSDLLESKLEQVRTENNWNDNDDGRHRSLAHTLRLKIVPLLLEYFHDDWRKARIVLGNSDLLDAEDFSDVEALSQDVFDLSDYSAFKEMPSWWNPQSSDWDDQKFVTNLK